MTLGWKHCAFQGKITRSNIWRCFSWKTLVIFFNHPCTEFTLFRVLTLSEKLCCTGNKTIPLVLDMPIKVFLELGANKSKVQITLKWDELSFVLLPLLIQTRKHFFGVLSIVAQKYFTKTTFLTPKIGWLAESCVYSIWHWTDHTS